MKRTATTHLCSIQLYSTCIVGEARTKSSTCTPFISTVNAGGILIHKHSFRLYGRWGGEKFIHGHSIQLYACLRL